jgi:hypothetical protein
LRTLTSFASFTFLANFAIELSALSQQIAAIAELIAAHMDGC